MNKLKRFLYVAVIASMPFSFAGAVHAQKQATSGTDEFFVVSSVQKTTLVLLYPTETTATIAVTDKTQIVDENGKALKVSDLRAGDTIFVTYSTASGGTLTATHVRKGMMTTAELRKRYEPGLPATTPQTSTGTTKK
jgi:hypothetical protein